MRNFLKKLTRIVERHGDMPLITITLSEKALLHNIGQFIQISRVHNREAQVVPVLKSNAYGHGLTVIARILEKASREGHPELCGQSIPFFVVDSYFEARALRHDGVKMPLLIIGYTPVETILGNRLKHVSFMVGSLDTLRELAQVPRDARIRTPHIHLKIDTGMHRQGVPLEELPQAIELIKKMSRPKGVENATQSETIHQTGHEQIILEGICSHFADADDNDPAFTKKQIGFWNDAVRLFLDKFPDLKYRHVSNTAGHAYGHEAMTNISRLGLGLYGIEQGAAVEKKMSLMPVLEMKTIISNIKRIKKGERVGYSCTFTAPHDMTIATVPVGYYEGVDRRLSSRESTGKDGRGHKYDHGSMKIELAGKTFFAPIVGRVSMNISTIDVSEIVKADKGGFRIGYPVTVISSDPNDKNSVVSMARSAETIPYEILVHIPAHLRRVVV